MPLEEEPRGRYIAVYSWDLLGFRRSFHVREALLGARAGCFRRRLLFGVGSRDYTYEDLKKHVRLLYCEIDRVFHSGGWDMKPWELGVRG